MLMKVVVASEGIVFELFGLTVLRASNTTITYSFVTFFNFLMASGPGSQLNYSKRSC